MITIKELKKFPLGTLKLTGVIESRCCFDKQNRKRYRSYVEVKCSNCNKIKFILVSNIKQKRSCNCECQKGKYGGDKRAVNLGDRYYSIVSRCKKSGIEVMFESCEHFIRCILENFPSESFTKEKDLETGRLLSRYEIGRIDKRRSFSPGNIKVTFYTYLENGVINVSVFKSREWYVNFMCG